MSMSKTRLLAVSLTGLSLLCVIEAKGDLFGYWPLESTSGITATNMVTGGADGILTNGAAWLSDPERGRVISVDGVDDYVDAGIIPALALNSNFTWSFWVYSQNAFSSSVILGNRWDADSKTGTQWIKLTPTKFAFKTPSQQIALDYVDIPQNQWIHHAIVKKGNTLIYYRDGVALITNATINSEIEVRPFYMGGDKFGERWKGRIDDVAIWRDALPADAIEGLEDGTFSPLTVPRFPTGTFDLADTVGGGDGYMPGTGGAGDLAATAGTYTNFPANPYVDGTFVPNNTPGAIVINGAGNTYDFDAQTGQGYYNPWRNGLNYGPDPSATNAVPNFTGDPDNHSMLSGHANKGITFDLDAVRDLTGRAIERFTAYIGDSRTKPTGSISYYVFVDGTLAASRFNITDDEDFISITQVSSGRYLTIVISDANNDINSDHGYIGDPFLTLVPMTEPEPDSGLIILIL